MGGLYIFKRFVDYSGYLTDAVGQVFQIGGGLTVFIGKTVRIRCAVGMGSPDENIFGRNFRDQFSGLIPQDGRPSQVVYADYSHRLIILLKYHSSYGEIALIQMSRFGYSHSPRYR